MHCRKCKLPIIPNGKLGKISEASLAFNGAKLFNVLPKPLHDMSGVKLETFKRALDCFLKSIPDEPHIPGYKACRQADSYSILEMLKVQSLLLSGETEQSYGTWRRANSSQRPPEVTRSK